MSLRTTVARFGKGLMTDRLTVGACLQLDDVVPLTSNAGWRARGGKRLLTVPSITGFNTLYGALMQSPAGTGASQLVGVGMMAGPQPTPFSWDPVAGTSVLLPRQAIVQAGTGAPFTHVSNLFETAGSNVRFGDEMWVLPTAGSTASPWRYGGANATTSQYTTGTVATTNGSNTITGTGTAWTTGTNVRVGQYILLPNAPERAFRITRINSATSITVDRVVPATGTGLAYRVINNSWWSVKAGVFGSLLTNVSVTTYSTMMAKACAQHQGRMFVAATIDADNIFRGDRVRWSAALAETDALAGGSGVWGGAEYYQTKAYIDVFPGEGGSTGIVAMASFGGQLFVFKTGAVYVIRGAFESDGRDTGASVEVVTNDDGLVGTNVIVTGEGIYWTGKNGLYLMTGSSLVNITDRSQLRSYYTTKATGSTGWTLKGWTGERLILQNGVTRTNALNNGQPNTLIYYPRLDLWVTQTTFLTLGVFSATNTLNANDEVSVGHGTESTAGQYGVRWADDNDFTTNYSTTSPNTFYGRGESPLLKLTSHPIMLRSDRNARIRGAALKAKWLEVAPGAPGGLLASLVLGEEGLNTGPEPTSYSVTFPVTPSAQAERWLRLVNRGGSPPVDNCRLQLTATQVSFDCRVYEMEVEHVTVARTRS